MQYIDIENCQIWSATGQDDDAIVGQKLNNSAVNNVCSSGHKMLKSIFGKYLFILQANLRSTPFKEKFQILAHYAMMVPYLNIACVWKLWMIKM